MLAKTFSCAVLGIDGFPVEVEVHISSGLPAFELIGLPDPSVREAKERVRSAIKNCGFEFPLERITVNLAPADLKKEGSAFDLAIAMGILASTGQIPNGDSLRGTVMAGELSLDGQVRKIPGTLAMASALGQDSKYNGCQMIVPRQNAPEASLIEKVGVRGAGNLEEIIAYFNGNGDIPLHKPDLDGLVSPPPEDVDLADVKGQENAKRALEISAAGGHNLLFYGPPGTGKTMLAKRLPTVFPEPSLEEMLEITRIYSVAGKLKPDRPLVTWRPFRSPHHSSSTAGVIGGGRIPQPGEVSLAHRGVLFLDEIPEFNREVLESLRQPLEDRMVTVTRAAATLQYPADFVFAASMNPCPCGNYGDPRHQCRCSHYQIQRYHSRLSGPLLDRIDLQVEVPRVEYSELERKNTSESSAQVRERVEKARAVQKERFKRTRCRTNAEMSSRQVQKHCTLQEEARRLAKESFNRLGLSMRAYDRILKVSRTVADMENCEVIQPHHLAEAIQYRNLDRFMWGEG